jgi:hypothetical protein
MFPQRGQVWVTARWRRSPVMKVFMSIVGWGFLIFQPPISNR